MEIIICIMVAWHIVTCLAIVTLFRALEKTRDSISVVRNTLLTILDMIKS